MGANQHRNQDIILKIQRNSKAQQKQLFDFTKQRILVDSTIVRFPLYLYFNEQSKAISFSMAQRRQKAFAVLDKLNQHQNQLCLNRLTKDNANRLWKLMKQDEQTQIQQGDFIKLGRIQLQLKQLRLGNKKSVKNLVIQQEIKPTIEMFASFNSMQSSRFANNDQRYIIMKDSSMSLKPGDHSLKKSIFSEVSSYDNMCRFCFDSTSSKSNPLLAVCKCAGSVKNVHFNCLKSWVRSKMEKVQTSYCVYYHYQPLSCQICKFTISNTVIYDGHAYKLFEPQQMHPPYARFQHLQGDTVFQILIRLEQSASISVGRGPQNELDLKQLSLSRSHCSFFYTSHKLFLKSKSSKYGTFIEMNKTIQLQKNSPLQLLFQNHIITIDMRQQDKGFFQQECCLVQSPVRLVVK